MAKGPRGGLLCVLYPFFSENLVEENNIVFLTAVTANSTRVALLGGKCLFSFVCTFSLLYQYTVLCEPPDRALRRLCKAKTLIKEEWCQRAVLKSG